MHYSIHHHQLCSVCNLANYFLHPSLVIYFFVTPAIKLKLGLQNRWETTNNKPPQPIIMIDQLENRNSSQILFITLFCRRYRCFLPALANSAKMLGQNHFAEPNRGVLDISSSNFNVQAHILGTTGDALPPITSTIGNYAGLYQCVHYLK
jgi:hypothetical protein